MRHAKSSWKTGASDHRRPLNKRGRRDAGRMAGELARRGWMPDHILTSDSERTLETLAWMHEAWQTELPTTVMPSLYLPGVGDVLAAVTSAPTEARTILVLSHNSACEDVVSWMTGERVQMTTANVARIEAQRDTSDGWRSWVAGPGKMRLVDLLRPKELDPEDID